MNTTPHQIIGWESESPLSAHTFNNYLSAREGHLYLEDLDLAALFQAHGQEKPFNSPLEIVYLPLIRQKIAALQQVFAQVIAELGYQGRFLYTYPSKANMAEEVVRTVLDTGVNYEISSERDADIIRVMLAEGHLTREQLIICNGFKPAGMRYAAEIIRLQKEHGSVIPVIEDPAEIAAFAGAGISLDVGLRQKSYGHHSQPSEMESANSRFGMNTTDLWRAAESIAAAPNLRLRLYHALVGSQIVSETDFVARLAAPIENYAQLRRHFPSLNIFDFGGGIPAGLTLDFDFDYHAFARQLLGALMDACARSAVPVPDVLGEIGRYTVAEHGAHLFKVVLAKDNGSSYPWYIINGSIMSSLPDTWALAEHFLVLPLNHLDKPFRRVQLGGLTCDSDDIYPPKGSQSPLYLPVETDDLYIGFFNIGAYQEMLGGVGGTKHCVIPEADELIIDRAPPAPYRFQLLPGQDASKVLGNLGYKF